MLYPRNGDRIVAIDSVTSRHPMNGRNSIKSYPIFKTRSLEDFLVNLQYIGYKGSH